jgi:hypothetical protein
MTPLSLVPEQAAFLGIDYGDLVEAIIEDALAQGDSALTIVRRSSGAPARAAGRPRPGRRAKGALPRRSAGLTGCWRCCRSASGR